MRRPLANRRFLTGASACLLLAGGVALGVQFAPRQQAKIVLPDEVVEANFGASVAVSGDTAVIGRTNSSSSVEGTVHVYTRTGTTWTHQATLAAPDGGIADDFG